MPERSQHGAVSVDVLGLRFEPLTAQEAVERIDAWAAAGESRSVCAVNVHSTMESTRDTALHDAVAGADMRVPDGAPVAWAMRMLGARAQERISGSSLMWQVCARAERAGRAVAFYGSTAETLAAMSARLRDDLPALKIAETISPPFRALSEEEDSEMTRRIIDASAPILFVGLGAPKQEFWMAGHRSEVPAVMLGVGAAFDYYSGGLRRAPDWMQRAGLEWAYRLGQEPRRLWRRYLYNNPVFVARLLVDVLRHGATRPRKGV
jgi:N-acetylglucosaminyldiphosphoundecaprenol N-acetyl-beta-D-mannosaminyltransferase